MEALQPVINGEMPVIFNVATVREMKRAIALAEEFNLKYILSGGLQSYQIADYLKSKKATVLSHSVSRKSRPDWKIRNRNRCGLSANGRRLRRQQRRSARPE
jgi:hypothetical protein